MKTIKYEIGILAMNSLDKVVSTLNDLPNTKCYVTDKHMTSATLFIEVDDSLGLDDIFTLGSLVGTIQTAAIV